MGAQTSKIPPEMSSREKAVLDRLASLSLEVNCDDDFVHVDKYANEKHGPNCLLNREPEGLAVGLTKDWQSKLLQDPKNRLALSALSSANPRDVLASRAAHIADQHVFNVRIPLEGSPVTNQRASGRCWLFASTNVFRVALMRHYGLRDFELSQAYLFFWDKLEKANYFLENIISTATGDGHEQDHALDGRLVQRLFADPASDGGQWDMVCNLVRKYGLVPQALYPDAWSAQSSAVLNYVVVGKLREYGLELRRLATAATTSVAALQAAKESMVREIHAVLTLALGPPPPATEPFVWEYTDAAGAAHRVRKTPLAFARDIAAPGRGGGSGGLRALDAPTILDAYVSLVHDPRHAPLTRLTVDRLGNVVGGRGVTYVNVGMGTLKRACADMLRAGLPVFFGCDVGKFSSKEEGIMDLGLVDYGLGFGVDMYRGRGGLDKEARLRVGESAMTHAMVLTGVHVLPEEGGGKGKGKGGEKERYARWRVQNSWGSEVGDKGWFLMSDAWMDEFVYQAVVDPYFLAQEVRDVLKQEPVVLPLWDPMGSLA
ncbi:peptidase C1-like family protein [Biscogniauxia sp. FL1348]|nr:peptidase C1-like family protein [Biscogniauxia sp. FL1348]